MMRRAAPQGDAPDHDPSQDADAPPKPSSPKKQGPAAPTCDSDPDENFQSAVEEQELPFNVNSMVLLSKGGFGAAYYARLKNNQSVVLKVARVGEDGSRGVAASEVWVSAHTITLTTHTILTLILLHQYIIQPAHHLFRP